MFRHAARNLGAAGLRFGQDAVCGFAQEAFSDWVLQRPAPPTPVTPGNAAGTLGYRAMGGSGPGLARFAQQ